MLWGALLIYPDLIDYGRDTYRIMAAFAPAWGWGLALSFGALLLLWSLFTFRHQWRMRSLTILFLLWLTVGVCLGLPNPHLTGFSTYFFVAAIAGIAHARAGGGEQ